MTFSLTVSQKQFEKHLSDVISNYHKAGSAIVPVVKGNGYGFGRRLLAAQVTKLGITQMAIGTVHELDQALTDFGGQIMVLEPFNPLDLETLAIWEKALTHNASRIVAVIAGADFSVASRTGIKLAYVEGLTSLHRFGVTPSKMLLLINGEQHNITILGLTLHLPIAQPVNVQIPQLETSAKTIKSSPLINEISGWINNFVPVIKQLGWPLKLSVSHVTAKDVNEILEIAKERGHDISIEVRLGTSFWLGNQNNALAIKGTVLAIHELTGDHAHIGYRQVDAHGNSRLLVVSGGTSHGVAISAPAHRSSLRSKSIALVEGFSEAIGKVKSPFKLKNKNLYFAEPPHMHVSLLWCDDKKIKVGDELECSLRNTTATFDVINFQ